MGASTPIEQDLAIRGDAALLSSGGAMQCLAIVWRTVKSKGKVYHLASPLVPNGDDAQFFSGDLHLLDGKSTLFLPNQMLRWYGIIEWIACNLESEPPILVKAPYLLTDSQNMRCVYNGPVTFLPTQDVALSIRTRGPWERFVANRDWLGIVSSTTSGLFRPVRAWSLKAFSEVPGLTLDDTPVFDPPTFGSYTMEDHIGAIVFKK